MLVFVIICNLLLTLFNIYLIVCLWRLRRTLVRVTKTLNFVERRIHNIFYPAPEFVMKGQQGSTNLRYSYQKLLIQVERLQKFVTVINLGLRLWRRQKRY